MEQNSLQIRVDNSAEWLASTGFIFPTNENELERFNIIHGQIDPAITGLEVDPFKIIRNNLSFNKNVPADRSFQFPLNQHQLVARNLSELPERIVKHLNKDGIDDPNKDGVD